MVTEKEEGAVLQLRNRILQLKVLGEEFSTPPSPTCPTNIWENYQHSSFIAWKRELQPLFVLIHFLKEVIVWVNGVCGCSAVRGK